MYSMGLRLGAARSGTPEPHPPHTFEGPVLGSDLWKVVPWFTVQPLTACRESWGLQGQGRGQGAGQIIAPPSAGPEWASDSPVDPWRMLTAP